MGAVMVLPPADTLAIRVYYIFAAKAEDVQAQWDGLVPKRLQIELIFLNT